MNNTDAPTQRWGWLGPALLFLLLPVLAFPEIIFGGQTLYASDLTWMHYPGHGFIAAEWLAGRVPLWDPFRQASFFLAPGHSRSSYRYLFCCTIVWPPGSPIYWAGR